MVIVVFAPARLLPRVNERVLKELNKADGVAVREADSYFQGERPCLTSSDGKTLAIGLKACAAWAQEHQKTPELVGAAS